MKKKKKKKWEEEEIVVEEAGQDNDINDEELSKINEELINKLNEFSKENSENDKKWDVTFEDEKNDFSVDDVQEDVFFKDDKNEFLTNEENDKSNESVNDSFPLEEKENSSVAEDNLEESLNISTIENEDVHEEVEADNKSFVDDEQIDEKKIIVSESVLENPLEEIVREKTEIEDELKKKNRLLTVCVCLLLIVIALLLIYMVVFGNNSNKSGESGNNDKENNQIVDNNEAKDNDNDDEVSDEDKDDNDDEAKDDGKTDNESILVYEDNVGKYHKTIYRKSTAYADTPANDAYYLEDRAIGGEYNIMGEIYVDSLEVTILALDNGYVLYEELGVLKLLDIDAKKVAKIDLEDKYDYYTLLYNFDKKDVVAIALYSDKKQISDFKYSYDKTAVYSFINGKIMYQDKYNSFGSIDNEYVSATVGIDDENFNDYLLSLKEEKVVMNKKGTFRDNFLAIGNDKGKYISYGLLFDSNVNLDIYSTVDYNLIVDNVKAYTYDVDDDGYLHHTNGKKVNKYDVEGSLISSSKEYDEVLHVIKGWYVVINDFKLYITNGDDVTRELGIWSSDYKYHVMISGYYEQNTLPNSNEKAAGIYLIVEYNNSNSENGGVEYYFNTETYDVKTYQLEYVGGYAKPVLYLYPEETMNVKVSFENNDALTTTYPKFKNSWEVVANPNGDLYDKDGKYYYGLYWEEDSNHSVDFKEGFYVTKDNAIEFLEEKLSYIGLSDKERNEFIMYWLPILEKNEQSLVYFELTDERENFNKIIIEPTPKSLLRMAIHVKKVDKEVNIKEQKLVPFERSGFTAVEWGGVIY